MFGGCCCGGQHACVRACVRGGPPRVSFAHRSFRGLAQAEAKLRLRDCPGDKCRTEFHVVGMVPFPGPVFVRKYRPALSDYLTQEVGTKFDPPIKFTIRFEVSAPCCPLPRRVPARAVRLGSTPADGCRGGACAATPAAHAHARAQRPKRPQGKTHTTPSVSFRMRMPSSLLTIPWRTSAISPLRIPTWPAVWRRNFSKCR